jgi:hypothetical protein
MTSIARHPAPDASTRPRVPAEAPDLARASRAKPTSAAIFPKIVRERVDIMLGL